MSWVVAPLLVLPSCIEQRGSCGDAGRVVPGPEAQVLAVPGCGAGLRAVAEEGLGQLGQLGQLGCAGGAELEMGPDTDSSSSALHLPCVVRAWCLLGLCRRRDHQARAA